MGGGSLSRRVLSTQARGVVAALEPLLSALAPIHVAHVLGACKMRVPSS
jgi:hypothetical protein